MKNLTKLSALLFVLLFFSCSETAIEVSLESVSAKAAVKSTVNLLSPIPDVNVTGTSTLHRNKNGLTMNFKANGLKPGAYTMWWVIWNRPEECATPGACIDTDFLNAANVEVEVMYGGGHVVGSNGKGNFSAHLNVGDDSGSINESIFEIPSAGGLQAGNTFGSEVHLVLRTHGPVVPGLVNEQIGSYEGGCAIPLLYPPFSVYPDEIGECADIVAAIHAPVN